MHVAIGAFLLSGQPGFRQAGVHHYARHLLLALRDSTVNVSEGPSSPPAVPSAVDGDFGAARPLPTDRLARDVRYTTWISPSARDQLPDDAKRALNVRLASRSTESPAARVWIEQRELPALLRAARADVYHGLGFAAPLRAPCPTVVSVMDLSFHTHPRTHKWINRAYLRWITRASCRRAARVITISEWTKRDVVRLYGIDPGRIDAIPLAADPEVYAPPPADALARFKREQAIGPRSILFLGSIEPRKNLARLLQAVARLPEPAQLFIGGSAAWKYDATLAMINAPGLRERVRLLGHVPEAQKALWYAACDVFAFPSLYEGFGLPPLEAMACGAAVVSSNAASLPEVVGDAGLLVEPDDAEALSAALGRVLGDDGLRADLRARGLARARGFSWSETARRTVDSYRAARRVV